MAKKILSFKIGSRQVHCYVFSRAYFWPGMFLVAYLALNAALPHNGMYIFAGEKTLIWQPGLKLNYELEWYLEGEREEQALRYINAAFLPYVMLDRAFLHKSYDHINESIINYDIPNGHLTQNSQE